ncbi:collagen alpha-6(VI) chain-like [Mercenaria mercenaria]|uniref:collagen alpha-6(VI) chain-like n=1 Tax=Mercenaria mercenaria TaxID=6596 RepID=UPI00234E5058|nr:collagen alpha-6(VI) chain-like [Mercenaria mercenaria]
MLQTRPERKILMLFLFTVLIKPVYMDKSLKDWSCKNKVADIVFLLDTSTSIWEEDFDKQIVFVEHIVNHLPIGENHVRVAVATFGSDVVTHFHLDDFFDKNNLLDAIGSIQHREGRTDTGSAIKHARTLMFAEKHGGRKNIEKIIVVITDGFSIDPFDTANEASICRSLGMKLISVGVGHGTDEFELKHIASEHEGKKMVFTVDDFVSLNTIEDVITKTTCDVIQTKGAVMADEAVIDRPNTAQVRKYCAGKPADVYFVVDSSSSIRRVDYKKMLNFITDVIDVFDIGPQSTRVGVVAFSDSVHAVIALDNNLRPDMLKQRIMNIEHYEGGTHTGSALRYLREQGFKRGYARENVAHVVILLTDGMSTDTKLTLEESKILKRRGTYLFVIGIGDQVDTKELQEISSNPHQDFVFLMEDFHVLTAIKNLLAVKTCLGITAHTALAGGQDQSTELQADSDHVVCSPQKDPVDLLYVYDSQFVGKDHSNAIENFIFEMILATSDSNINAGLVSGACERPKNVPLSKYKNMKEIKHLLKRAQAEGVAALLKHVRVEGFSKQNGGREGAEKKVVLFIDGAVEDKHFKMRLAVKRLMFRSGVDLFVVSIGKDVSDAVSSLLDNSENLIQTISTETLVSVKQKLTEKLCRNNIIS